MGNTISIFKPKYLDDNYNVSPADSVLICTATSGSIKFNLPTASDLYLKKYSFKNTGAATLSVDAYGSETIDGNLTATLNNGDTLDIIESSGNWVTQTVGEVNTINSTTTGEPTGSDVVLNVVSLTQAEYDAGTPVSTTFYIITDA